MRWLQTWVAVLMLTSLIAQSAMGEEPLPTPSPSPSPPQAIQIGPKFERAGFVLTPAAVKALANQKRELETCKVDLTATTASFKACNAEAAPTLQFWQTPVGVLAIGLGAVVLGGLAGAGIAALGSK